MIANKENFLPSQLKEKMKSTIKFTLAACALALLSACGGGGTTYQTTFNANVSGLNPGESLTVVASLYADRTITQSSVVSQNGMWSSTISLPDGKMFAFDSKIEITKQPTGKSCAVTYSNLDVTSTNNTIKCVPISAAGLYTGKLGPDSGSGLATLVILNDDSYWMFFGSENSGTSIYTGLVRSDLGKSTASTYTSSQGVNVGNIPFNDLIQVSGNYTPNLSFDGFLTERNTILKLSLKPLPVRSYQFTEAPSLDKVSGSYSSATENFTISSPLGLLVGTNSNGCQYSGNVSPKKTGENIYDLTITYKGIPCPTSFQNATFSGIFLAQETSSGNILLGAPISKQLLGAVINPSKTIGTFLIATKK